jgi:hypothetical protein
MLACERRSSLKLTKLTFSKDKVYRNTVWGQIALHFEYRSTKNNGLQGTNAYEYIDFQLIEVYVGVCN